MIRKLVEDYAGKTDYADARVHEISKEVILLENGETSNIFLNNKSYGVRILYNGGWGMAYSYDFDKAKELFEKALKIAKLSSGKKKEFSGPKPVNDSKIYDCKIDPFSIDPLEKIKLLKEYESLLKGSRIKNIQVLLQAERVNKSVYAPGVEVSQEFTNNIHRIFVTAKEGRVIQSTGEHYSRLGGYEMITSRDLNEVTSRVNERIDRLLHAKSAKPERAAVVCDPAMTGLFFHEAVGHACEADAVINNASLFKELIGRKIASQEVTLVDDPTIEERGFYWYDDEGVKSRPTALITNGVLSGFMHSLKTANEMNVEPTGNGRVMNAENPPIPRMSNTSLKPGKWSVEELIHEARNGYYVKGFNGGVVDPITGQFSFGASECFKIVNGEVMEPLRDVTLAGNILEALKGIRVGNDQTKNRLTGTCGKSGQHVRVGDYCPSILVREVVVGGSA
jgi:TldD protein